MDGSQHPGGVDASDGTHTLGGRDTFPFVQPSMVLRGDAGEDSLAAVRTQLFLCATAADNALSGRPEHVDRQLSSQSSAILFAASVGDASPHPITASRVIAAASPPVITAGPVVHDVTASSIRAGSRDSINPHRYGIHGIARVEPPHLTTRLVHATGMEMDMCPPLLAPIHLPPLHPSTVVPSHIMPTRYMESSPALIVPSVAAEQRTSTPSTPLSHSSPHLHPQHCITTHPSSHHSPLTSNPVHSSATVSGIDIPILSSSSSSDLSLSPTMPPKLDGTSHPRACGSGDAFRSSAQDCVDDEVLAPAVGEVFGPTGRDHIAGDKPCSQEVNCSAGSRTEENPAAKDVKSTAGVCVDGGDPAAMNVKSPVVKRTAPKGKWGEEETIFLMKIRSEQLAEKAKDSERKGAAKSNTKVWDEISALLKREGSNREPEECQRRFNTVGRWFNRVKDNNDRSGLLSYWKMSPSQRVGANLNFNMRRTWYDVLAPYNKHSQTANPTHLVDTGLEEEAQTSAAVAVPEGVVGGEVRPQVPPQAPVNAGGDERAMGGGSGGSSDNHGGGHGAGSSTVTGVTPTTSFQQTAEERECEGAVLGRSDMCDEGTHGCFACFGIGAEQVQQGLHGAALRYAGSTL
ncbi:hypothetical protein CBR_g21211 [Chara braunii]|uniref:Myb-like domain-containing protein n=1 Tax=Chara braunii TaxID=69332 RepID=A0A388L0Z7_CHABU|nr:hypothetical protein CBR_g21211 [Chara braunii]|eukprot:GBG75969.1 hypothetical protein CBR_g21211 [Chara braunii]